MIFGLILLALVAVIGYWHYLQGCFSAGLSALIAMIAAVVAVSFHEAVVQALLGGKIADYGSSVALIMLFAAVYLLLRLLFDQFVPGNVRFPLALEKAGAGVFGLVAGIFAVGVVALAAQAMPFGPAIAGFERYPMKWGVTCTVKGKDNRAADGVFDMLQGDEGGSEKVRDHPFVKRDQPNGILLPVDEWLIGLVNRVSDKDGPLSCGRPFEAQHPDYLQELFGQRLGIQSGSKHVAMEGRTTVTGAYFAKEFTEQYDPERSINNDLAVGFRAKPGGQGTLKLPKLETPLTPRAGTVFVVVRTRFSQDDTDANGLFSFTPASIRICYDRKNYFPIGTLEYPTKPPVIFYVNQPDDCLFVRGGSAADLVFELPLPDGQGAGGQSSMLVKDKAGAITFAPDTFLEVKRLAHVQLDRQRVDPIDSAIKDNSGVQVLRKDGTTAKSDSAAK